MRYIYGPVKSRRLGLSLGISLTPLKVCSFDCVYCQLGKTADKVSERKAYLDIKDILAEFKGYLESPEYKLNPPEYISLSGFGEPTLNIDISKLIAQIKKLVTRIPLVLITNSSLFSQIQARLDVLEADVIIPSLDAVTQDIFEQIDRPLSDIKIEDIIQGLIALRKEFKGKIFLEIMLVKDINDSLDYAYKFKQAAQKINPDKIQLNIPARSTAESWVREPDKATLLRIKEILGPKCEIVA